MKYLAILKDSFLETIDFKLFYVLIGISVFLTLGCLSLTFPRLSPDEALNNNLGTTGTPMFGGAMGMAAVQVSDVQTVSDSWFTPRARYRFVMTPEHPDQFHVGILNAIETYDELMKELNAQEEGTQFRRQAIDIKGEGAPKREPPKNEEEWKTTTEKYLNTFMGMKDAKVHKLEMGEAGVPKRIEAEVDVNWAQLPNSHEFVFLFGVYRDKQPLPLGLFVFGIQVLLVDWIAGWAGIIIAVIVTAGFIPNMLRKGTVDFLLVKPLARPVLLVYKYLGGLTFVLLNAVVLVTGTWIAFGITTDNWSPWYLTSIFVLTFYFAILYSLSVLIGVLTRSMLAAILVTIGCWFIFFIVNGTYTIMHQHEKEIHPRVIGVVDAVHFVLPKPSDLSTLNQALLWKSAGLEGILGREISRQQQKQMEKFSWSETILTSLAFIVLMLGLACWRFSRKDY